jgi:hypothetical protein
VREEANTIRTTYLRSAVLPEPERAEAGRLLQEYMDSRLERIRLAQSGERTQEHMDKVRSDADRIQGRLWEMAVANARKDMEAYEEMIRETATEDSPWYVVPADNKWFTRVIAAAAVIDTLASLNLHYPKVGAAKEKELVEARKLLLASK